MNYYLTPNVVVHLEVVGSGAGRILLDDVVGIMYEAQGGKIPVFSHKSIEFDAIAEGRSMVSGMLVVNKQYKDAIAGVINAMALNQETVATFEEQEEALKDKIDNANLSSAHILFINDIIVNINAAIDKNPLNQNDSVIRHQGWAFFDIDAIVTEITDYDTTNDGSPSYAAYKTPLNNAKIALEQLIIDMGLVDVKLADYVTGVNITKKHATSINNDNNKVLRDVESIISDLLDTTATGRNAIVDQITEAQVAQNELTIVSTATISKIYGTDLFKSLRTRGYKIQLVMQFGSGEDTGNHEIVIDDCYFASESVNVSVQNRDNIKEAYSFIAKSIK